MATYATYFHLPSMVHAGTTTCTSLTPPRPTLQLLGTAQSVPQPASKLQDPNSVMLDAEREPVSASLELNPPHSQEKSLFFRLPAELRNKIYEDLLCPDATNLKALARRSKDKDLSVRHFNQTSTSVSLYPSILSTCRRIHQEAQRLLYTTHTFHAHPSLLTSLPHLASPSKPVLYPSVTSLISRWQISLRLDTDPRFTFDQATAAFSNAEHLEIRVWQAQFEACDYAVLKLFTGVRGVQVARVGGSVDPELARWLERMMMLPAPVEKEMGEICRCDGDGCPGFGGRSEILCGRCYKKAGVEWVERDWDLWRFGGR